MVELAELRRDDPPPVFGQRELRLEHPRGDGKRMDQQKRAALAHVRTRHRLQIAEPSYSLHEPIVSEFRANDDQRRTRGTRRENPLLVLRALRFLR